MTIKQLQVYLKEINSKNADKIISKIYHSSRYIDNLNVDTELSLFDYYSLQNNGTSYLCKCKALIGLLIDDLSMEA